ncbi:MAG: DUF4388 domain-containing protein [Myxococcota bacterium]
MANTTEPLETLVETAELTLQGRRGARWLACSLETLAVSDVVEMLVRARRSGCLQVTDGQGTRELYLESGQYTGATSTHLSDRLGEVLWRLGKLSLDQVLIAGEMAREGRKFGRCLVELGYISPTDVRGALVDQAMEIFSAACTQLSGHMVFHDERKHPQPMHFGMDTAAILQRAVAQVTEVRALEGKLVDLETPCAVLQPSPAVHLGESEQALLQLAASSREGLGGRALIQRSGLGRLHGMRALRRLLDEGILRVAVKESEEEQLPARIRKQCRGINAIMTALDGAGFGAGDALREFLANPPPFYEEALSGISLDDPLEPDAVLAHARFISGGLSAMETALSALIDDGMMQASDTLPEDDAEALRFQVESLGVL